MKVQPAELPTQNSYGWERPLNMEESFDFMDEWLDEISAGSLPKREENADLIRTPHG